ncbi:hypothetical protein [Hymenobacter sp.]|uniref:hypothetical protein n=1 Tax=Hymenobacter sp. TaxID=1898978 RepID=UPI00286A3622|nr:hypothetical protein [Hymenobacter sp.]
MSVQPSPQYQLFVHAQLDAVQYGIQEGERHYEVWTKMCVWKFPENKWLGESRFNTLMGKPYNYHPTIEEAVGYSVVGLLLP